VDPYAVLALLGFVVFLFYIIYNFLNRTGSGRRNFPITVWSPREMAPIKNGTGLSEQQRHLEGQSQVVYNALEKYGGFSWASFVPRPPEVVAALSLPTETSAIAF
jgi:hypothetical protein